MFEKQTGISVYIGVQPLEKDLQYIELAKKYGFKRIFSCFLCLNEDSKDKFLKDFEIFMNHAKKLDFDVYIDVTPLMLKLLGVSPNDLSLFSKMGVAGIRLDESYSGAEEAMISCLGDIKVEINASNGTKFLDNILSFQPNRSNLMACHNFYPKKYTGLAKDYFMQCSRDIKQYGIKLAAFVSSQAENTFSSQHIKQGLPTMEHHRNWQLISQAKELYYCGLIDDVIISNAYASEQELKALSTLNKNVMTIDIITEAGISELCQDMLANNLHMNRGDASEYLIRSTMLRIKYKENNVEVFNNKSPNIKKGEITIDNDLALKYKGELNIARKNIENDGSANVVAKVADYDMFLLDYIKPWTKFNLNIINK